MSPLDLLNEFYKVLIVEKGLSSLTIESYKRDISLFCAFLICLKQTKTLSTFEEMLLIMENIAANLSDLSVNSNVIDSNVKKAVNFNQSNSLDCKLSGINSNNAQEKFLIEDDINLMESSSENVNTSEINVNSVTQRILIATNTYMNVLCEKTVDIRHDEPLIANSTESEILKNALLVNISKCDFDGFLAFLFSNARAERTVARALSSLKQFYQFLYMEGHIEKNPTLLIDIMKKSKTLPTIVSYDTIKALFNAIYETNDENTNYQNALIMEIFYAAGLRVSELIAIKFEDIVCTDNIATMLRVKGKGNQERFVPLTKAANNSLHKYLLQTIQEKSKNKSKNDIIKFGQESNRKLVTVAKATNSTYSEISEIASSEQQNKTQQDGFHTDKACGDSAKNQVINKISSENNNQKNNNSNNSNTTIDFDLQNYLYKFRNAFLFPSQSTSRHITRQYVGKIIKKICIKASVALISPHSIRHAFATHMLECGADIFLVQKLLGHASIATTQIYTHVLTTQMLELLENHHPLGKKIKFGSNQTK
jgi:site-specific recombinase XerD